MGSMGSVSSSYRARDSVFHGYCRTCDILSQFSNQSQHEHLKNIPMTEGRTALLIGYLTSLPQRSINWHRKQCQPKKYLTEFFIHTCLFICGIHLNLMFK